MRPAVTIIIGAGLAVTVPLEQPDIEDYEQPRPSHWVLALRFSSSNIVSVGYGVVLPVDDRGVLLGTFEQFVGVLVNVFVFAVVLTKFAAPSSDLVWSLYACVIERDGVPHLLLRIGNLRCHTLFQPEISLTLICERKTREGEAYSERVPLHIKAPPPTISAMHTVAHVIDGASPLYPLYKKLRSRSSDAKNDSDGGCTACGTSIHASFVAQDPVYQAALSNTTTYYPEDILTDGSAFKSLIKLDRKGRPVIDWSHFDETEVLRPAPLEARAALEAPCEQTQWENARTVAPDDGRIWAVHGGMRVSFGRAEVDGVTARTPMLVGCPFCFAVHLLLEEAGVDHSFDLMDMIDEHPAWFKASAPSDSTPLLRVPPLKPDDADAAEPTSTWLDGSFDAIADRLVQAGVPGVARALGQGHGASARSAREGAELHGPASPPHETASVTALQLAAVSPAAIGAALSAQSLAEAASSVREIFRSKCGAVDTSQEAFVDAIDASLQAWQRALAANGGGSFLAGGSPGRLDLECATQLFAGLSFLQAGMVDITGLSRRKKDSSADEFIRYTRSCHAKGTTPALPAWARAYFEAWESRSSWRSLPVPHMPVATYLPMIRTYLEKLHTFVPEDALDALAVTVCANIRRMVPEEKLKQWTGLVPHDETVLSTADGESEDDEGAQRAADRPEEGGARGLHPLRSLAPAPRRRRSSRREATPSALCV